MRIVDAAAARAASPFERLIPALHALFRDGCTVPARHVHEVDAGDTRLTSLIMPAWTERRYGIKVVNVAPANGARGLPGLHSTYQLFDAATGVPLALIDGDQITTRRTVAASALAASFLARQDAHRLLVVGAGRVASLLPQAYRAVRPIEQVSVWARSIDAAVALAARLRAEGFDASPSTDLAASAAEADVVSCATLADTPLVQGRWLRPGTHLDLIGSFTPAMREADDDCFRNAGLWIDTGEALVKSGELLGPMSRGVFRADEVRGTLADLARGTVPGRTDAQLRTVFKSVGTALEDVAAAMLIESSLG